MKLKKIASLMLAGIMAVSMLAGCKGASDGKPVEDNDNVNQATGVSADLYNELSLTAQRNISLSNSSKLDAALKDAVNNYVTDPTVISAYENLTFKNSDQGAGVASNVRDAVIDALKADVAGIGEAGFADDKTQTGVVVAVAGSGMSNAAIVKATASWINDAIEGYVFEGDNGKTGSEAKDFKYEYTGSVSIAEKSAVDDNGVTRTVKFIAVSVTRTATEI